jgi:hypothetical protein
MERIIRVPEELRGKIREKIDEVLDEFYADGHNSSTLKSKPLREALLEAVMNVSRDNPFFMKSSEEIINTNSSNN